MSEELEPPRGTRDGNDFHVDPKSPCCKRPLLYYDRTISRYMTWCGYPSEKAPEADLVCDGCNVRVWEHLPLTRTLHGS